MNDFDPMARGSRRLAREYNELPGLSLTFGQAQRLLDVDPHTCGRILSEFIRGGRLVQAHDGRYLRWGDSASSG